MEIKNIVKKINSHIPVGKNTINELIENYCKEKISDEEILPIIEAIYKHGLFDGDLVALTNAMKNSGDVFDTKDLGKTIDKHSSGGVSDTTTIVIAPICACLGVQMLKVSGRSLGFTGGTCNKLESFKGYKTELDLDKAKELVKQNGACIITSSKNLTPADKKIYALRDRTGLVDSISLIASSIMSKKLATGADIIVLDVKYGNGAFMPNKRMAKLLGLKMLMIGLFSGKRIKLVFGKMNQPLGYNIGPKLEAMEAVEILSDKNNNSLLKKECIKLASICVAKYKHIPYFIAKSKVRKIINNSLALQKLKDMVLAQGGSLELFDLKYPKPNYVIKSTVDGKVNAYKTKELGEICYHYNIEIKTHYKLKDMVEKNDVLYEIFFEEDDKTQNINIKQIEKELLECIEIKR